ncbi:MAG: glycosyl hydrolase [Actinomycetaceae bacterium]|nr:glycosyl hydrolase [Actinomycetaceae bacterium]
MSALENFRQQLSHPPIDYRPELRWWLAEGFHTDATLRAEIDHAHRLGFGGMEFLAMDEEGIDHSLYGWGSEEWTHDSHLVVEETTARNMSVSFTSGTNWSNANLPTITPDDRAAAQELNFTVEQIHGQRSGALTPIDLATDGAPSSLPGERCQPTVEHLVAVVAIATAGQACSGDESGAPVLDLASAQILTSQVTGPTTITCPIGDNGEPISGQPTQTPSLDWKAPDNRNWLLFTFWQHGTGQTASPSASRNVTVNYIDRDGAQAVIDYWDSVILTPALRKTIAQNPRTQMYMDSLELNTWGKGGMFWGFDFSEEFSSRRGYDIDPYLPFLTRSTSMMAASTVYLYEPSDSQSEEIAKVRHDYVETLTDVYIENMLRPFAAFLHDNGIALRAEISYGLPFELTRPGPEVDGIETESLEFGSQIDAYRLLAGPAHLFGKQYSSETGATTRNHMLDHRFYDQIIATQLAAGVTKTVLHGWSSMAGAPGTQWPGHEGMWSRFSERFDRRQPSSEFYPLWNEAIGRLQYALRQGKPRIDVGILYTDHFVDNMSGMALVDDKGQRIFDEDAYGTLWMRNRQNHWWADLGMQDAGWSYEFFDGSLLTRPEVSFGSGVVQPEGPGYQALIVFQEALNPDVAKLLLQWARQGCVIAIVHGARSLKLLVSGQYITHERAAQRTPGRDGRDEELAETMAELLKEASVVEVDSPADTVDALRRLGVKGRAEFSAPNQQVLTYLREDGDLLHLYAYHFLYESSENAIVDLHLDGHGSVFRVDQWNGLITSYRGVSYDRAPSGDITRIHLNIAPGEVALFTIDRSISGVESVPAQLSQLAEISHWNIAVESWDAGENEVIEEDRGLGYVTTEIRPTTAITRLETNSHSLAPWKDLDGIGPDISGVGEYQGILTVSEIPSGRILLDLGSTSGGLASIRIGDSEPIGVDTSRPVADITGLIHPGDNRITIRTASSLNNRLKARGYYDQIPDILSVLSGGDPQPVSPVIRDYGLIGPVRVYVEQEAD